MSTVETLTVSMGDRSYPIHFGHGLAAQLGHFVSAERDANRRLAIITDANVHAALAEWFEGPLNDIPAFVLPPGETSKSLTRLEEACEFLGRERIDRAGLVLAVGGGVVGDLAGFAAASFLRGIDFWQVPTTLLAMVDSAVGGKTGVNLKTGKNLVGAFHQPRAVFCDTSILATLPEREFSAGMAEVIKSGLLADAALFASLQNALVGSSADARLAGIVRRCCEIKAAIVKDDERETAASGGRALLNLGHTFAHAIEAVAGYGEYLHGEAVGIGLVAAARLSERLGLIGVEVVQNVRDVVAGHRLPVRLRAPLAAAELVAAMSRDKKVKQGRLWFVVLEAVGRAAVRGDVEPQLVEAIWTELGAVG